MRREWGGARGGTHERWELAGPDADERSGLRPRCARCGVTIRGRWPVGRLLWKLRHRIGCCYPDRLDMRRRVIRPIMELRPGEEPF